MNIPNEFKGKIHIMWAADVGMFRYTGDELIHLYRDSPEYVMVGEVGPFEFPIDQNQVMNAAIATIDQEIEKVRAESTARIAGLTDKRNSLLAIEHQGAA